MIMTKTTMKTVVAIDNFGSEKSRLEKAWWEPTKGV